MNKRRIFRRILALTLAFSMLVSVMMFHSAGTAVVAAEEDTPIYLDMSYSFKERAADLVSRMTFNEKQTASESSSSAPAIAPRANLPTGLSSYSWWNEALHGIARVGYATAGNPTVIANATSYPSGFGMGTSWDPEMMWRVTSAVGDEGRELAPGFNRMLNYYSPTVNLIRDPRWGRTDETFSEDPVHAAMIAAQFINGFEGKDMDGNYIDPYGYKKANTTIKHYYANNAETNRTQGSAFLTEQDAREYYSYVYRQIIKRTDVSSVMSAYNRVQINEPAYSRIEQEPSGISHHTLQTLLRQTFGFQGYVTADCNSVRVAGGTSTTLGSANANQYSGTGSGYGQHHWRAPSYSWPNADGETSTIQGMTANIPYDMAAAWAIMGEADLECNAGTSSGRSYESASLRTSPSTLITPAGRWSENAIDVTVLKLMESRIRLGEFDDKVTYGQDPNGASTGRVSWFDQARKRVADMGLSTQNIGSGNPVQQAVSPNNAVTMTQERLDLSAEAGAKAWVLLKNDPVAANDNQPLLPLALPMSGTYRVGVYGSGAAAHNQNFFMGWYSSTRNGNGNAKQKNFTQGIREQIQAELDRIGSTAVLTVTGEVIGTGATLAAGDITAINRADTYDMVICVVTDVSNDANENSDRTDMLLKRNQALLIPALYDVNPKTVTMALSFSMLDIRSFDAKMPAFLHTGYIGDYTGVAAGMVLTGAQNPSGRTNSTWYPISSNGNTSTVGYVHGSLNDIKSYRLSPGQDGPWNSLWGRNATTGADVVNNFTLPTGQPNRGRTYMHYNGTGDQAPRFVFGEGLSYTTFGYSDFAVTGTGVSAGTGTNAFNVSGDGDVTITFKVTNTGTRAGADVAQFYVKTPDSIVASSSTERGGEAYAIKRLKDFVKTKELDPGESQTISVSVDIRDLAFWSNTKDKFELVGVNGPAYAFQVSRSSADSAVQYAALVTLTSQMTEMPDLITFSPNTAADKVNDIPQRLFYEKDDVIIPNPTVCMNNDVLYGYVNKTYEHDPKVKLPAHLDIKYSSNRPNVANVSADGKTITAIAGGVATITGTVYDTVNNTSVSNEFIVYVRGEALDYDVSIATITTDGVAAGKSPDGLGFDISVPAGSSAIPAVNYAAAFPDEVNVDYTPPTAVPGEGKITVTSKTLPDYKREYPVYFGSISVGSIDNVEYMGLNSYAFVRFGDGVTQFRFIQAFYKDGILAFVKNMEPLPPVPKNESATITVLTDEYDYGMNLADYDVTVFLWDGNYVPLTPASSDINMQ